MTRIRGVLIDNSSVVSSIYTNISSTVNSTPTHNLATIKNSQFFVTAKTPGNAVSLVTDTTGWSPANTVTITQITPMLRAATSGINPCPIGTNTIISVRYRPILTGIDTVLTTIQLPASFTISVTATSAIGNVITCAASANLVVGMPVYFTNTIGNIQINTVYYVLSIPSSTTFTISTTLNGTVVTQITTTGVSAVLTSVSSVPTTVNYTLYRGDYIFTDVTQVGNKAPGMGLITYYYYN